MSRAGQCSTDELGSGSSSPGNSTKPHHRRRVRKRRYPVSRQALGLDFFQLHTMGVADPVAVESPPVPVTPVTNILSARPLPAAATIAGTELVLEEAKRLELCRKVQWSCVVTLLLVVFRGWIVMFLHEAPFAWPSINGNF